MFMGSSTFFIVAVLVTFCTTYIRNMLTFFRTKITKTPCTRCDTVILSTIFITLIATRIFARKSFTQTLIFKFA